jgi:hypothetical protein
VLRAPPGEVLRIPDESEAGVAENPKKGDRVEWNTPQGRTRGRVKEKLTEDTRVKGHTARASEEDPQYLVESEKSGAEAAHRPDALDEA